MFRSAISRARDVRRDESGFTLIELLMVIIVLGVLAAVVVFSVQGIDDTGEDAACKTEYRSVLTAIEAHYAESKPHNYPANLAALTPDYLAEPGLSGEYVEEADYDSTTGELTNPC